MAGAVVIALVHHAEHINRLVSVLVAVLLPSLVTGGSLLAVWRAE